LNDISVRVFLEVDGVSTTLSRESFAEGTLVVLPHWCSCLHPGLFGEAFTQAVRYT